MLVGKMCLINNILFNITFFLTNLLVLMRMCDWLLAHYHITIQYSAFRYYSVAVVSHSALSLLSFWLYMYHCDHIGPDRSVSGVSLCPDQRVASFCTMTDMQRAEALQISRELTRRVAAAEGAALEAGWV